MTVINLSDPGTQAAYNVGKNHGHQDEREALLIRHRETGTPQPCTGQPDCPVCEFINMPDDPDWR